jgi:enamine deaminase RidA (YjgF/YER057c/UK114 family)
VTAPRFLNPKTIAPPPGNGYTHVVEATGPGRTIYIAGQLGLDPDGSLVGEAGDFRAQAERAFENLRAALEAVGADFKDVVKVNNFLIDIKHLPLLREVRNSYFNMAAPPASTTIAIVALAREGALFEIDAVAVLPA